MIDAAAKKGEGQSTPKDMLRKLFCNSDFIKHVLEREKKHFCKY